MTTIEWNDADNSLEIILTLHGHELEAKLSLDAGKRLSFLDDRDIRQLEALTQSYVMENLSLNTEGSPIPLTYVGMEARGQLVLVYIEANMSSAPSQLAVMNALLLDALPGQVNSVVATIHGIRKGGDITSQSNALILTFP